MLTFDKLGGLEQLRIDTPEAFAAVLELDKALWVTTSAPIDQFVTDEKMRAYLDADQNGRFRLVELQDAVRWLLAHLRDRSTLMKEQDSLALAAFDGHNPESMLLRTLAESILREQGVTDRSLITLAQVRAKEKSWNAQFPNGDGTVPLVHSPNPETTALIEAILAVTGGTPDASGEKGVRAEDVEAWKKEVEIFAAWKAEAEQQAAKILPLGPDTAAALELVKGLEPKINQFFSLCTLLLVEEGAAARLKASPEELASLNLADLAAVEAWLARAPLARPDPSGRLLWSGPLHPRHSAALQKLATDIAPRLLGRPMEALTAADWAALRAAFAPYEDWRARKPLIPEDQDPAALLALRDSPTVPALLQRIAEDASVKAELDAIHNLEKLLLFHRWLPVFVNNFVSLPDLFHPERMAMFQMGTMIIDGRKLNCCLRVDDRAAHKKLAEFSKSFVIYAELINKVGGAEVKRMVAAPVTAGVQGGIQVGKRGVFYDRDNVEWDAVVVELITHPISVWEAAMSPFRRIRSAVFEKIGTLLSTKASELEAQGTSAATTPAATATSGGMSSMMLSAGVIIAAAGSAVTYIVSVFASADLLDLMFTITVLVLAIMGVSALVGWFRLQARDISALLEAGGWAMNGRIRLTDRLSEELTIIPDLPPGSTVVVPAHTRSRFWYYFLVFFLIIGGFIGYAWYRGLLDDAWAWVQAKTTPAATAPAEPPPAP